MEKVMPMKVQNELRQSGVVAVLEIEQAEQAVDVAKALVKGGITAIELALRTEAAIPSIKLIHDNVPEMKIGIGTIIKKEQVQQVQKLGALFGVSPGFNPAIVQEAIDRKFPFAPGVSTASEVELAYNMGCDLLKLFPAEALGGIQYLKSMSAPYAYLGINYFPLGGVTQESLADWADVKNVITIGGSWIASKQLIQDKNFDEITRRATAAMQVWKAVRG